MKEKPVPEPGAHGRPKAPSTWTVRAQWFVVILLLAALYLAVGVFDHSIWAPTEPAVSGVVWNMFVHGDVDVPRIHEFNYFEKPPLNYWVSLLFCKMAGRLDAGWIRLPSALYGLLGLLIASWVLRGRVSPEVRLSLLLLAATGGYYYELSHRASSDTLAMFFAFACWAVFVRTLFLGEDRARRRFLLDVAFCLLLAASFYAKNFFTHLVVLPPVFLFLLWRRKCGRCFAIGLMTAIFSVLLIVPWAAALYESGGWDYLRVVFVDNTLGRFLPLGDMRTHGVTPLNDAWIAEKGMHPLLYLETLLYCTLPWVLFYIVAVAALFRRRPPDDFRLFLRIALISVPVVLTLSASRVVEYLAPILFILFLMAGEFLQEWLDGRHPLRAWERWFLGVNAVLVAVLSLVAPIALAVYLRRFGVALWIIPGVLYLVCLVLRYRAEIRPLVFGFLAFSAASMLVVLAYAYPALDEIKSFQFFFEDIRAEAAGRELYTTFCDDRRLPQITFYLNDRVPIIHEREMEGLVTSGRRIGLILPPALYEEYRERFQQVSHTVIEARRGKKAYVFVGIPAK